MGMWAVFFLCFFLLGRLLLVSFYLVLLLVLVYALYLFYFSSLCNVSYGIWPFASRLAPFVAHQPCMDGKCTPMEKSSETIMGTATTTTKVRKRTLGSLVSSPIFVFSQFFFRFSFFFSVLFLSFSFSIAVSCHGLYSLHDRLHNLKHREEFHLHFALPKCYLHYFGVGTRFSACLLVASCNFLSPYTMSQLSMCARVTRACARLFDRA